MEELFIAPGMDKITYYRREVYGKTLFYLTTGLIKDLFTQLTWRKTITEEELKALSKLTGKETLEVIRPNK